MMDLAAMDRLIDEIHNTPHFISSVETFLISLETKHKLDVAISQRPHQRLLRKCQYRRIYRRRKRGR